MKTWFRAFGIGLFLAGMCLALINQFDLLPVDDKSATYKKEIKALEKELATLQDALETSKESTGNETSKASEETNKPTAEEGDSKFSEESDNAQLPPSRKPVEDVTMATIFIYEGMTLYEIGQQIEGEGIVLNGREVELYLARPEYARSIQKGSFDLRSDMTLEEIAKILTGTY